MGKTFRFTIWQIQLLARYQILTVAFVIAAIYIAILLLMKSLQTDMITTLFVFLDPTGMGFIFIGAMILFEKGDNTLEAQVVTPMGSSRYLWSKALALLLPALICSFAIAFSTHKFDFHPLPFFLSVLLSSLVFTFIGIAGVIRVNTFNQYMILIPLCLAPTSLPLLNYLQLTDWSFLYVIPTQSTLNLLEDSFNNELHLSQILDVAYLGFWTWLSYFFAKKQFEKIIYQ